MVSGISNCWGDSSDTSIRRRKDDLLIAPLRRRGDAWAALAFTRRGRPFERHDSDLLGRIAAITSEAIQTMDRERMLGVRDRIDRKIMEQLHPKDLFYQILDGLRSLTRYDHSSALLIRDTAAMRWRSSPSRSPGRRPRARESGGALR